MEKFIIIETVFGSEYRIAIPSHRFIGTTMYMTLADVYYLGEISENSIGTSRHNKFSTYELADAAVKELNSYEGKMDEYD